jgi:hypothetical protein
MYAQVLFVISVLLVAILCRFTSLLVIHEPCNQCRVICVGVWMCPKCNFSLCVDCSKRFVIWNHEVKQNWCYKCCVEYELIHGSQFCTPYTSPSTKSIEDTGKGMRLTKYE